MLRDGVAFLVLLASTGVLFAVTLFLFRSFAAHRVELASRYSDRGRAALGDGHPKDAIAAFRTSLSYGPGERENELLLAQALADDNRIDEATDYFLNLWDSQPGDGFINLQLARLARRRNEHQAAIDYYRASIYGNWNGDGTVHRRDVRLELANYLIGLRQISAAQAELLIAASNAPAIPSIQILIGDALLGAGDPVSASRQYQRAFAEDPRNAIAYEKAGRLAYKSGDYSHARDWLEHALHESAGSPGSAAEPEGDTATLLRNSERLLLLDPAHANSDEARLTRLIDNRATARKRIDACARRSASPSLLPAEEQSLIDRWTTAGKSSSKKTALLHDPEAQAPLQNLIDDTEIITARLCGAPQGDDALLLLLAKQHQANRPQ
jgi:tetratricopeptide (TPR) repeat protein